MNKLEEIHCIGCGVILQTKSKEMIGFTPASVFDKGLESNNLYCQRCFRLRHYNEIEDVVLSDDDFLHLLNEIRNQEALIVNVVDIFDFNGSLIPSLHRFIGDNEFLLVANKRDVLPHSLKLGRLIAWIKEQAATSGLRPTEVQVISSKNQEDVLKLMETIEQLRNGRDVYIVGTTNVGKSTLINEIIRLGTGESNIITTSRFPGTTLDRIEIPLDDTSVLVDTPGIIHRGQMAHYLNANDLKLVSPKKEIKPKVYQLNSGQTLFLGGLARFDFIQGEKQGFVGYFDNELEIHRTKLMRADEFYRKHAGEFLNPSISKNLVCKEFSVKEKTDIVFSGLGWICVPSRAIIAAWVPEEIDIIMRKALI